jgi:hypothetical protein
VLLLVDLFDRAVASAERWSMKSKPSFAITVLAGKALKKFCDDHGRPHHGLDACVRALEAGDSRAAMIAFEAIPWSGGMMSFGDWIPPVIHTGDTPEYVQTVFESLTERFYRLASGLLDIRQRT